MRWKRRRHNKWARKLRQLRAEYNGVGASLFIAQIAHGIHLAAIVGDDLALRLLKMAIYAN